VAFLGGLKVDADCSLFHVFMKTRQRTRSRQKGAKKKWCANSKFKVGSAFFKSVLMEEQF
jgi:hypothetical protein